MSDFDYEKFKQGQISKEQERAALGLTRKVEVGSRYERLRASETFNRDAIQFEVWVSGDEPERVSISREQWIAFRNEVDQFYTREQVNG